MIDCFSRLSTKDKDAVLALTKKDNQRINVLDQWEDDSLPCVLIRANTWSRGVIRFILYNTSHEVASAFRFPDSPTARQLMHKALLAIPI